MPQTRTPLADAPPVSDKVTDYDRAHLKLYARLLDAERDAAPVEDVAALLFGIDAQAQPERARSVYEAHLSRARWMTDHGYRDLIRSG